MKIEILFVSPLANKTFIFNNISDFYETERGIYFYDFTNSKKIFFNWNSIGTYSICPYEL